MYNTIIILKEPFKEDKYQTDAEVCTVKPGFGKWKSHSVIEVGSVPVDVEVLQMFCWKCKLPNLF